MSMLYRVRLEITILLDTVSIWRLVWIFSYCLTILVSLTGYVTTVQVKEEPG